MEGLFRRSATASVLVQVQKEFNKGMPLCFHVFAVLLYMTSNCTKFYYYIHICESFMPWHTPD